MNKICIKCKIEKQLEDFHKDKKTKDCLNSICKACRSTKTPGYGEKIPPPNEKICITCNLLKLISNFPKRKECKDGYRNECKDCRKKRYKEYVKENCKKLYEYNKEYRRKWIINNRQKSRDYTKKWRQNNVEKRREYDNKQRQIPHIRMKRNLRCRIRDILRKQGAVKSNRTMELIGCSIKELMIYLQSKFYTRKSGENMTLQLLSTPVIEIDHIIPLWKFDLTNLEEQKRGFHYTNMRPMWAEDHNIKSGQDYQEYCAWKRSGLLLKEFLANNLITV